MATGLFLGVDGTTRPVDVDTRRGLDAAAEIIGANWVEMLIVTPWGLECAVLVDDDGRLLHKQVNGLATWFMRCFALTPCTVVGDAVLVGLDPTDDLVDLRSAVADYVTAWRAKVVEDVAPL